MLLLKIKIVFDLKDKLLVYAKVLFFRKPIVPSPQKKDKKEKKGKPKKKKKAQNEDTEQSKDSGESALKIVDHLNIITDVSKVFFGRFTKHSHVKLVRVNIKVASDDAAKTAILYGTVSAALSSLIALLDEVTNLDSPGRSNISVVPDYLSDKSEARIKLVYSIRVIGLIDLILQSIISYTKAKARAHASRTQNNENNSPKG